MPDRRVVAKELAEIFKLVSHPDRIRLIEELADGECDVNTLHERLDLPATRVSQHLALLRAHRIVEERREGRHVFYHLTQPEIADWIVDGLDVLKKLLISDPKTGSAVETVRRLWTHPHH
ncbi:MAG TPA: metalloregulator ArsR/SmtB family transcription factor [Amphiplicatus sp.]|nr:helix-turn-helix transcriptional regulator [Amphiplicatus sp.]MCB9956613.1 helix-turn-helix transcriptional regulator [Caulobacterales bacterium]HOP18910.1 metalloregulator ArsR/SmtB family transcription factor [Amphiplicatus sp.]HRX38668.1 metalloregulator ArsR/SmtB family transcription factor [Parvularculaceae bacterium]